MMKKYWNRLILSVLSVMTAWTANGYYVGDGHLFTEYGCDGLTARAYYRNEAAAAPAAYPSPHSPGRRAGIE